MAVIKTQARGASGQFIPAKLTDKQKAFADRRLDYPKESRTESALKTYPTKNRRTAATTASLNMKNPNVLIYMEKHKDKAQQNIIELANKATNESVKLKANQDILDRTFGRPLARSVTVKGSIEDLIEDDVIEGEIVPAGE